MTEDFVSAAARHLDDARLLLAGGRHDNSAYLAGYVAECSVKILLVSPAPSPQAVGHDLSVLTVDALQVLWIVAPAMRRYVLPHRPEVDELIRSWTPELRYGATGTRTGEEAGRWVEGAASLFRAVVAQSVLDGWSPLR